MVTSPQIFTAKVMHKRLFPRENAFCYGVYYLALPLPSQPVSGFFANFDKSDVGKRDGSDPTLWVKGILSEYGFAEKIKSIFLVTMPRILGYVFNPVSFYFCHDEENNLLAVLCEVHNTFDEQHSYLCANVDHTPINPDQWLEAEKIFHVSPFLQRSGTYKFRFSLQDEKLGIWIDYFDADQKRQLLTSLIGNFTPLTAQSLRNAFWKHPLVALKSIILIHWQALKIIAKGIKYIPKPKQNDQNTSTTWNLNKM